MTGHFISPLLSGSRLKAALWLAPVCILGMAGHWTVLPLARETGTLEQNIRTGESNVYESGWLDSVSLGLNKKISLMRATLRDIQKRSVNLEDVQSRVDEVRQIVTGSGLEVLEIKPSLLQKEAFRLLSIRIDGITGFPPLMDLFRKLNEEHPEYAIEKMTVRKTRSSLRYTIYVSAFSIKTGKG
ncbi:hypothetical protein ACFL5V_05525 [Fibrobacterota bacterium]